MAAMVGSEIRLRGWISAKRNSGKVVFLTLRDGNGFAQLVCERSALDGAVFEALKKANLETPLIASGTVVAIEGRAGPELNVSSIRLLPSEPEFPIGRKEHGPDFLMENRHLWLRSAKQSAYLRIRSSLEYACVEFLHAEGYHRFDAPLITPNACEGTTELFELDYFGEKAYLSQSGQLYSEAGVAALEKVYSFGPCFRAETSRTRRHLTEFWGVEPEAAWMEAEENMSFQERFIRAILAKVAEERAEDLAFIGRDPSELLLDARSFPVILYEEALARLAREGRALAWGEDLGVEDEEVLSLGFDRPFFIYKYPVACRAFYIEPDPDRPEVALSSDCLMHGGFGEIITGGQRASDYDFLRARIIDHGLSLEDFSWYLDLRRFGSVPHSGFGMGIERMLRWICGIHHIREAVPFARTPNRCRP
jgi:asparaginyl-tRNA synthetase